VKETISSFDLATVISEIKEDCIGARINNIYQIDSIFVLKLRTNKDNLNLLIEPAKRVHITEYQRPKPKIPPAFCMTLRKYLRRKVIIEFRQYYFDRVLIITAARKYRNLETGEFEFSEKNTLICEFFNRGLLILLNDQNKIIISTKYKAMRDRRIIPNRPFDFAPVRGLDLYNFKLDDLKELIQNSSLPLINFLASKVGIGGKYAEECALRLGLEKNISVNKLNENNIENIYLILKDFINKIINKQIEPVLIVKNNSTIGFEPFNLLIDKNFKTIKKDSFNATVDEYFSQNENLNIIGEEISKIDTIITKQDRIIQSQRQAIEKLEKKALEYKIYGDLTYQFMNIIQEIFDTIKDARNKGYSWNEIKKQIEKAKIENNIPSINYINNIKPADGIIILEFESKLIPFNFRLTPQQNAENFYSISKKSRKKLEGARKALNSSLEKLKTSRLEKEVIPTKQKQMIKNRKKKWFEKFRWFISSDDLLIIGGRDIKTNEIVFRKHLSDNDIFLHADFKGSPAVVIKNKSGVIPESTIIEAAQFTVAYSSAWKSKYMTADAYWVNSDQVSLTPPSGQYLPKGSFMIRGKKNYIKNVSMDLAIGIIKEDNFYIPITGPLNAIKKQSSIYLKIKPGNKKRSEVAKEIKQYFIRRIGIDEEEKSKIINIPLDEIIRLLPGEAEIIKEK